VGRYGTRWAVWERPVVGQRNVSAPLREGDQELRHTYEVEHSLEEVEHSLEIVRQDREAELAGREGSAQWEAVLGRSRGPNGAQAQSQLPPGARGATRPVAVGTEEGFPPGCRSFDSRCQATCETSRKHELPGTEQTMPCFQLGAPP